MNNKKNPRNEAKVCREKVQKLINLTAVLTVTFTIFVAKIENSAKIKTVGIPCSVTIEAEDSIKTSMVETIKLETKEKETTTAKMEDESLKTSRDISEIIDEINPNMDISGVSGISKEDFIFALHNCPYDKNGVLQENADLIWQKCQKDNLHEFAVVGFIAAESGWCDPSVSNLTLEKCNILSIKKDSGEYKEYNNFAECINDGIRLISEEYISEEGRYATGGNLTEIGATYAPGDDEWSALVAECAEMTTRALVPQDN